MSVSSILSALIVLLAGDVVQPVLTSDPIPSPTGAPQVSFLEANCRLELTGGVHWQRLWLNCGCGPHLVSEPSSLSWHVSIRRPEQALELVRMFTSQGTCDRFPPPEWLEVGASPKDDWLAVDQESFRQLCPVATAKSLDKTGATTKRFVVTRCLLRRQDGGLYSVEEQVRENGMTEISSQRLVLPNAERRIGNCKSLPPSQ